MTFITPVGQFAVALALVLGVTTPGGWVGVEMPAAGIDGAQGLSVRLAAGLGSAQVVMRDSAAGGFANPHQDEGVDNDVDLRNAPNILRGFAADARIVAAIGGLSRRVGDADAVAAQAGQLPTIVLSRWSRNGPAASAYCLCVSPARMVTFARTAARKRFGPRLLVVLIGEAVTLKPIWMARWGNVGIAEVRDDTPSIASALRRARAFDAVLVLADERPATLWRSTAFGRCFDLDYVRNLAHRDFESIPAAAPPGSIARIAPVLPRSAAHDAFGHRFHALAGYLPSDAATRAYAAVQILQVAGISRHQVRDALRSRRFSTVAGYVGFDADGFSRPYPLLTVE
jgi:hypothetical protein